MQVPFITPLEHDLYKLLDSLLNLILDVGVDYTKLRDFAPQTADSKPVSSA